MTGASVEATLELWVQSLRDVKARMRPLFTQERGARFSGTFLGRIAERAAPQDRLDAG
jgi:hypothetical protein